MTAQVITTIPATPTLYTHPTTHVPRSPDHQRKNQSVEQRVDNQPRPNRPVGYYRREPQKERAGLEFRKSCRYPTNSVVGISRLKPIQLHFAPERDHRPPSPVSKYGFDMMIRMESVTIVKMDPRGHQIIRFASCYRVPFFSRTKGAYDERARHLKARYAPTASL